MMVYNLYTMVYFNNAYQVETHFGTFSTLDKAQAKVNQNVAWVENIPNNWLGIYYNGGYQILYVIKGTEVK